MGAAHEFKDLDFVAARDNFERLTAAGAKPGAIVKMWRESPPQPAVAGEESSWARYAREHPHLYKLGSDDDQALDDQALDDQALDDQALDDGPTPLQPYDKHYRKRAEQ
jgi:hypothetical protein